MIDDLSMVFAQDGTPVALVQPSAGGLVERSGAAWIPAPPAAADTLAVRVPRAFVAFFDDACWRGPMPSYETARRFGLSVDDGTLAAETRWSSR